jgi:primosomal protein N' (replication factor Y)
MPYALVALPVPVRQLFTYRVPEALDGAAVPGAPVEVPFRGRAARGVVVERIASTPLENVRDVSKVLGAPLLSAHVLALARWVADYYLAPPGEVVAAALPGGQEGFARSRARREGALPGAEDRVLRMPIPERITLTPAQRDAAAALEKAVESSGFQPYLLHGVTASGKTEVYMRAARAAREAGGQALVLVPEVALATQVLDVFAKRFGGRVAPLHSYLPVGARRKNWELARRGAIDVVVGARSAVFAPLPNLKLIVVDEEHEPAYKQSEQLRYHGRDVAVRRAQLLGIPVVLGSATPSLETQANAARGKYRRLVLPERVDKRPAPGVRVVDLRREGSGPGVLSAPLRAAIGERLARGEQTLLWLNRRGHSHHIQCRGCGHTPECPHCDISLTLHVEPKRLRCHYCDHREPVPATCPKCGAALLHYAGAGTQRAERELAAVFPNARVLRLDLDVARENAGPGAVLGKFARGEGDILLGTQMIAKGLDFPRVTLVGVIDADVALHLPDFRAAERTFQLLVQVAGRSGRGKQIGEVLVQTCTPEHAAVAAVAATSLEAGERTFRKRELDERRDAGYPPFTRLVTLLVDGPEEEQVEQAATGLAERARALAGERDITVLGPAPQALSRLRGRYRWHVLLKAAAGAPLREIAATLLAESERPGRGKTRVIADVDPIEVL